MFSKTLFKTILVTSVLCLLYIPQAVAQVNIVTTTTTLGDIARQIGGNHVKVHALMKGPENVHDVKPKPSFVMKLRKADLFITSGLDAEMWVGQLLHTARKKHLMPGQPGYVDASRGIQLMEVPQQGQLSRANGDIHVYGNPHYDKDPMNGIIMAGTIAEALKRTDPAHAGDYDANLAAFTKDVQALTTRLQEKMKPFQGEPVIVYHTEWPYFLRRFGLVRAGEVEPKPGIAPGPQHLAQLAEDMKQQHIHVVLMATYNNRKIAQRVADNAGAQALLLAPAVNAVPQADTYQHWIEYNINTIAEALAKAHGQVSSKASNN